MSEAGGTTMRAWQVTGTGEPVDVLHAVEVPVPEPGPGQIRVRVTAAGIGLPDVLMCRGTYPLTPPLPFTPGQEATGVITAVGEGVDREIGSRVMFVSAFYLGHGSFAEECLTVAADRVSRSRRTHRRGSGRVLDPPPHRVGRARRSRSSRGGRIGSRCSARPAAAASPRCNSDARSARASSRS